MQPSGEEAGARVEYKFVRYDIQYGGGISPVPTAAYQAVINDHAAQGWRLVQIFAPQLPSVPSFYDLIKPYKDRNYAVAVEGAANHAA